MKQLGPQCPQKHLGEDDGQKIVVPSHDLVIVHRVAHAPPIEDSVSYRDVDAMVRMVMAAAPMVAKKP